MVNCLPGQRVVEDAIEEINAASQVLNSEPIKVRMYNTNEETRN